MSQHNEHERIDALVSSAQEGDTDAFGEIYDHFFPKIHKYIFYKASENDVEDLVSQVFIKAWCKIKKYQKTQVPFSAWLYRIAHNTVIDYYRTHKPIAELNEQDATESEQFSPERRVEMGFSSERVHRALRQIGEKYQQVMILKFLQDLSNKEIAEIMDMKETSVRTLQFRALALLRSVLEEEDRLIQKKLQPEEREIHKTHRFSLKRWLS